MLKCTEHKFIKAFVFFDQNQITTEGNLKGKRMSSSNLNDNGPQRMNIDSDTDIDSLTLNDDINDIMTYSTINDGHNSVTTVTSSQSTLGTEQNGATKKRRAIQEIMRDNNLSEIERRHKIQALMDGSSQNISVVSSLPFSGASDSSSCFVASANGLDEPMSCVHYERKCNIVAPCCNRVFGCRVCHDEMTPFPGHGPMDRFKIKEVVCKDCNTRQSKSNQCVNCGVRFAEYFCDICNLWMQQSKQPFHCAECGFCRVGGQDSYRHCKECCMCISVSVYDTHNCMKDKYKNNCPVCREDMFTSRQSPQDLPCGHAIHAHCFRKLAGFDYRCPICKKTVVSHESMSAAWAARAKDIREQPMPADLARLVNIMCNDCESKSEKLNWHFLGVQCPKCTSFNTVVNDTST